jgi:diguanylate cyclase (GGDEF)-like protein
VVTVLVLHSAGLPLLALLRGYSVLHAVEEPLLPAAMAALACWPRLGRPVRSALAATGLMVVSGILVHLSGGAIEAHFHFFVMVPIVALYESWVPFGLAIGYVLFQHGIVGTLNSSAVYNHAAARERPWVWAAVHSGLFAASCLGALANWKLHERARATATAGLIHQVHHDPLTGLANRTLFQTQIGLALTAAARTDVRPTVLLLDLDGFKDVNDTLGHHHGDLVLMEVAEQLRSALRTGDTVARLGGDEFAMLVSGAAGGTRTAERIAKSLSLPFCIEQSILDLEVSIGIACAEPGEDALTLIRHADAAMYEAKANKLGWVYYGKDLAVDPSSRHQLLGALRRALEHDEILLHYQPKTSVADGRVVGAEALARWQHPSRGLLGPAEFLPLLEDTTLSFRFTAHVLATALGQTRTWLDQGIRLPVAVNVSTRCLLNPHFAETVARGLVTHGVPRRAPVHRDHREHRHGGSRPRHPDAPPGPRAGCPHLSRRLRYRLLLDDLPQGPARRRDRDRSVLRDPAGH